MPRQPRRRSRRPAPQTTEAGLFKQLSAAQKWLAGTIGSAVIIVSGWIYLELPIFATRNYVNTFVAAKLTDIARRIDSATSTALLNRIETLSANRSRDQGEQSELELRLKSLPSKADPNYIALIHTRQQELTDDVERLTKQITAAQNALNQNTATPAASPPPGKD
jgi:hypothetical protein